MKNIYLIIVLVLVLGVGGYFFLNQSSNSDFGKPIECTTEAKICPDGSGVGRSGPNCEFTECPVVPKITEVDVCGLIMGSDFRSVEKLDRGLGPNGMVFGYWNITFNSTSFSWGFSDVGVSGSYSCDDGYLEAIVNGLDDKVSGKYNPETAILIWDGVEYTKS